MTDDTWLNRISALLAKADSTEFPDEREALIAKAQALMSRHSIDAAMLAGATRSGTDVIWVDVSIEAPYVTARSVLLSGIAEVNDCESIRLATSTGTRMDVRLFGTAEDLENVQALYASLALHGSRNLGTAVPPEGTGIRRFRQAFMVAFGCRITERLQEAKASAVADVEAETGQSVGLALRDKGLAVQSEFKAQFPRTKKSRIVASSQSGMDAGTAAANRANLGQNPVMAGGQRALGS